MSTPSVAIKKRSKLPLFLIALCFFAPVIVAWFLQSPLSDYKPQPTKNFGDLITPVVPIDFAQFQAQQTSPKSAAEAQWSLLYLPAANCGACEDRVKLLAHIRQAAGREIDRVNLHIISDRRFELPAEAKFSTFLAIPADLQKLQQRLRLSNDGGLLIVDPLGNAVMRFAGDFDGTKVRKDLMRLLKVSQTGKSKSTGVIG
jgi:hypothetical protein